MGGASGGDSFTHLHLHSEFSMLDGAARVKEVIAAAVEDGQPAIGITDHGNMYGVLDFYKEARKQGIKPIIGCELYMAGESRFERPTRRGRVDDTGGDGEGGQKLYYHLTTLAENETGYRNLIKLSSEAFLSGWYYKPRCLLPGQEIVTRHGLKAIQDIRPGDEVLTHRGRFRKVLQTMSRQHEGDVYGVRLSGRYQRTTWMTGEHPVLVRNREGSRDWVEASAIDWGRPTESESRSNWNSWACLPKVQSDAPSLNSIRVADFVSWEPCADRPGSFSKESPRKKVGGTRHYCSFPDELTLDYDLGHFIGLFVAEGHVDRGTAVTWSFHEDEHELIDRCSLIAEKLAGKPATINRRPDRPDYHGVDVHCYSAMLAELLESLCGNGARNKHLPAFVFEAPEEFQRGLLDGVVDGDGAINDNAIIFTQTSRNLAWQVRTLRATLNDDFASVMTHELPSPQDATQYRSCYSPRRTLSYRRTDADDDYVYKPILGVVRRPYSGPVFNIEVEEDHSYVSDFAIHNCDWELLERHHEGVIATTGCLGGVVLQSLLNGEDEQALKQAGRLQDIFGRDNLFVEIQDHGLDKQKSTNPKLVEIAKQLNAPLLATNDSHYVHREDAVAHDALLCVQTGSPIDDPKRFKFEGEEHYLKSAAEMRHLFGELPEACNNTLWIAERSNVEIEFGKPELPNFDLPPGFSTEDEYLRHLTLEGARERYGSALPPEVTSRIDYELGVIADMGFSAYFLVVWDLIKYARDKGIRVGPGRGSAAGCCVAYCLRIVDLDPIRYDLLFERFLNPGRKQMPDIDMDFDERYRGDMIRYAAEKYGWDHVAQIVTFSTIKARAAVRDSSRVLGFPPVVGDRIAKLMPPLVMGRDTPLHACLTKTEGFEDGYKTAHELRQMYETDPDAKKVIDVALGLENLRRQDSIHAAAVVITKEPLTEYLPIQRKPENGKDPSESPIVTQYEMHGVEELGLLKMDFLGLRNLTVIERALDLIEESRGERFDIDNVPLDDEKTLQMLRDGDSMGVFQLEGGPMRALMRSLAPTSFDDVAALVALYRPGPMKANMHNDYADRKNGRQQIKYLHADAEEILSPTYGLCLTGDTIVHEAVSGRRVRLDDVDPSSGFWIQGVDDELNPAVRQVTHWVCNGVRDTAQLRLQNGMSLTGTPDHQVLTYDGWKPMGSLTSEDRVAVPKRLVNPALPGAIDRDRLRVLAYLIADGSLSSRSDVAFSNKDPELTTAFCDAVTAAFPGVRPARQKGARDVVKTTVGNGKGHGGGASPLLSWLRSLGLKAERGARVGGPKSEEKFVPDTVFQLPEGEIAFFLAALWDCDGHVNSRLAHYKTISPRLAKDVQALLMRLGFEAPIYRSEYVRPGEMESTEAFQVTVYDGERFMMRIAPHMRSTAKRSVLLASEPRGTVVSRSDFAAAARAASGSTVRALAKRFGIPRWHFSPYAAQKHPWVHASTVSDIIDGLELTDFARLANVVWVPVDKVTPAGSQSVYDITVDEIHNFVANGMVVHNCIYQESVMRVAQKFAGYSLADADTLRKCCGKKIRSEMAKEREKFVAGCAATGYGEQVGNDWWEIIEPFADYAFNKSHSYGYGFVAYQTAYLKAHYPVEYLAALLTSVKDDKDKTAVYLAECRALGIQVLVPDVNVSQSDFIARDSTIPFGLSAIRNVGEGLVAKIVEERSANGPFTDFYDFCERVDPMVLNKRTVESLIKGGAFDSLGHPRKGLLIVFEQIVDAILARRRERELGIMNLFGDMESPDGGGPIHDERVPIPDDEFDKSQRLAFEKEMLGLYVSDHPLMGVEGALARHTDCSINGLRELRDGETRWVGGVVTALQRKYTKRGELMATFVLEDLEAAMEVMVFPRTMHEYGPLLDDDAVVCVKGRVDLREEPAKIICLELKRPELVADQNSALHVNLPANRVTGSLIEDLKKVLLEHSGQVPVFLHLGQKVLRLPDQFNVATDNGLLAELRVLLGPNGLLSGI